MGNGSSYFSSSLLFFSDDMNQIELSLFEFICFEFICFVLS